MAGNTFLTNRPAQKPMIEDMSYAMALVIFGVVFLISLCYTYFTKVHPAVTGLQTNLKRVIITEVPDKLKNPILHKDDYCLKVTNTVAGKLYFPKYEFDKFEIGAFIRVELSEHGKQIIRVTKASESIIKRFEGKVSRADHPKNFPTVPYSLIKIMMTNQRFGKLSDF